MWKRVLITMIIISLYTNFEIMASNNTDSNQYNIIKSIAPYILNGENIEVNRRDCISVLMKLIGVDKLTADMYAGIDYDQPVFKDISGSVENDGYIIIAKFNDVAKGIENNSNIINSFEPDRYVTVKECLTFMLRCLKDSDVVEWDNVMLDSVRIGLLQEDELEFYVADAPLQNKQFYTLLHRMLDKKRYLYWPIDEPSDGYIKSMQVDKTNSIRYINWILENNKGLFNY